MPSSTHFSSNLFTEADLVWDPPSAPPTRIDLRLLKTHEEDTSHDILADLEAVTPRLRALQLSPLSDLTLETSPAQPQLIDTRFVRRAPVPHQQPQSVHDATAIHVIDWPCLPRVPQRSFHEKAELSSPKDIAYGNFPPSNGQFVSISAMSPNDEMSAPIEQRGMAYSSNMNLGSPTVFAKRDHISKSRRSRQNTTPQPSRFCHICARTQKSRKMFCANLNTEKKCRKAVCEPCFKELRWDFDKALQGREKWHCPHCRGMCGSVPRARCHIYTKTNEKRKAAKRS